jgi:hypothetical protein
MNAPTAYHQLGQFIVKFQHLENAVNDLIVMLADTNDSVVQILTNDLEYGKRLITVDVLFSYFVDLRHNTLAETKADFHRLIVELRKLGDRRNDLVHSRYSRWLNVEGNEGLLRTNSKLRGHKGEREETEEELLPEAFDSDLRRLSIAAMELDRFRRQILDWLYPE